MGLQEEPSGGLHRAQILAKLRLLVWSDGHKGLAVPAVKEGKAQS